MTNRSSKEIREELKHMYRILYYGKYQAELMKYKDMLNNLESIINDIKGEQHEKQTTQEL